MATEDLQTSMTITEALAEVKTINARIASKRSNISTHLLRDARLKDPMEADGGQAEYVRRELQAIADLGKRLMAIRSAIQVKNHNTLLTLHGITHSVASWLTWRKEVVPSEKAFFGQMAQVINRARVDAAKQNLRVTDKPAGDAGEVIVNINEKVLAETLEKTEHILGDLDGKLSLINATTVISL